MYLDVFCQFGTDQYLKCFLFWGEAIFKRFLRMSLKKFLIYVFQDNDKHLQSTLHI